MAYRIIDTGESASFPQAHDFLAQAHANGEGRAYLGAQAGQRYRQEQAECQQAPFVAIELDLECLGVHTGDDDDGRARNVVGFARFRLGDDAPTRLIELVRKPYTSPDALQAACAAFAAAGLEVAVCNDFPGRILNRLVRPYYNAALRRLDEGLASADDMDTTLRLGLGYPEGPIALLGRTGLHHHYRVSQALYETLGQEAYAPARRARVAWQRHLQESGNASA
ncbi:3-hydroxyacyl-CoA dehydrogenase family protein [Achromobacter xylosoxidans]|uniref:3-hydroxyacyl-CoA dehydrogenase family protein n=1 Tax=Alcaligenes xylosoxydans xylosoxydans TaxID=85698 RepID=UPI000B48D0AA|nr:3-hydroxyacyl-CoA dehydrogenase family protein [Achromobacter xylosoxidans]